MKQYDISDFPKIKEWFTHYGTEIANDILPDIGFITDHAACFLLTTNSKVCFLEPLVGDPKNPWAKRAELDSVMIACLDKAKEMGFKQCFGLSSNSEVLDRAFRLDFKVSPSKITVVKEL